MCMYLFSYFFIYLFVCLFIYLFIYVMHACMYVSIHTAYRAYNACIYERGKHVGRLDNSFIGWLPVKGSGAESW